MKSYQQIKIKIREIRQQIAKVEKSHPNSSNWLRAYWEALDWVINSK